MFLEKTPARVLVNGKGMEVIEVANAFFKTWMLQAFIDGVGEEFDVGIQRELVHGVNATHVIHHKEK